VTPPRGGLCSQPRLAPWGCFGALALWAAAAAWAADGAPPTAGLRALRDAGWACLDRGDTDGALRAAARMLQLQAGCRDALLLEDRAHQARLATAPTGETPLSRPASSLLDEARREGSSGGNALPACLDALARPARGTPFRLDQPITIELVETPLPEAVRRLSDAAGLPIRLAPDAAQTAAPITLRGVNMPLHAVLRWVGRLSGLHYAMRGRAIVFTARPGETEEAVRQAYDLHDLMAPPKGAAPDPEALGNGWARYIRATVAPGTWEDPGQDAVLQERNLNAIAYRGGRLVVVHTPEVQTQVAELLDMFRRERNLVVHIQCRFIIMTQAELTSVGVDYSFDSLLGPNDRSRTIFSITNDAQLGASTRVTNVTASGGLSLTYRLLDEHSFSALITAVTKRRQGVVLSAPRITCLNTQRASLQVLTNHNYIRRVSGDDEPEIGNIPAGMIFDVQPFVSADRRYITLTLQPQQRELTSLVNYHFLTRTLLTEGGAAGVNVLIPYQVIIQIPTTQLRSVGTTVTVPNGGTLLVAGLAEVEELSGTATLPGVQNVPLLRHLLRRTEELQGRRSLVILVTAQTVPDVFAD